MSRPRKRIALLGATELEAAALGIVLESRGYCVRICESENAAMRMETPTAFLILGLDNAQRARVESRLRLQHGYVAFAMESHCRDFEPCWMQGIVERLGIATRLRRGPRPQPKHTLATRSAAGERKRAERNRGRVA